MQTFKKLLYLLSAHERKRAGLLFLMILVMAILDMLGVASILPFIAVLTNPNLVDTSIILNTMFKSLYIFGVKNNEQFIFFLGVIVFLLLITSLIFKTLTTYLQIQFVQMREYTIGKRLVERYLHQPYSWFLSQHSADLGKNILSEVNQVIGNGIGPLIELIAKSVVAIMLIILLIIVDPILTLIISLLLILSYSLTFYFVRNYLNRIGEDRLKNNNLRFLAVNETFGAIKQIKLGGLEKNYIKMFSNSARTFARTQTLSQTISQLPRFILEAISFGGILLIILYIISKTGTFNNALPIISLYVFAGYRLMPALQQIYGSVTSLKFVGPGLNKIYDELTNLEPLVENQDQVREVLSLSNSIALNSIYYNYPNSSRIVLKDISLFISSKSTVGLMGPTGCGKTTTIDIILGLLESQKGTLEVDGKVITKKNIRSWQRLIGYVPQHIYFSDDTVAANIAFGVEFKDINQNSVEKVARIACIHDFVVNELPKQYQTTIGERGIRLSGGQCQRIGIARALYHNPELLILDEATSALDYETEKAIIDAISNLRKKITIIIIAHRLNTLKICDKIFVLDKGELKNQGTFEEVIAKHKDITKSLNR
jgi:ABC-type multidrug transport system fused ATPase/permease subunit